MRSLWLFIFLCSGLTASMLGLTAFVRAQTPATISGVVIDANGPLAGVTVRIQATEQSTRSAKDGSFTLNGLTETEPLTVTASAPGYYISWQVAKPGEQALHIELKPYYQTDNPEYEWFEQTFDHGTVTGSAACGECHTAYPEWQADAHSQSARNYRFLTLYSGTDVRGKQSPQTRLGSDGKYAPPDSTQPYYGPGFLLDNPGRAGSCATCHTPMAAKIPNNETCGWSGCHLSITLKRAEFLPDPMPSPTNLKGDAAEGISCEFCHKIGGVTINDKTNLPYDDSPGILSMRLFRPSAPGHDLIFGPFDDIARSDLPEARDAYLPLQSESQFCAGCHYGVMGGVVGNMQVTGGVLVYSSYAEWLASPYSDPATGKTCQDCHMPPVAYDRFVFAEKGGVQRSPQQINNHRMLGKTDADFLASAVTLTATAQLRGGQVVVDVALVNDNAGHAIPTDSVLHHLLLVVTAKDTQGKPLRLQTGTTLPAWVGNYASQPGRTFAKILQDKHTGETPSAAFWREVVVVADTRLQPFAPNRSRYTFAAPLATDATVEVQLIYRRAFQQLMEQKGWSDADIVMQQARLTAKK